MRFFGGYNNHSCVLFVVSLVGLGSDPMTFPHNPVTSQGDAVRLVLKLPSGDRVERTFDAQEFDFFVEVPFLGGGFNYCLTSPLFGEDVQFDSYVFRWVGSTTN